MKVIRELFSGLFIAIASGLIVLSALSLAAVEGAPALQPAAPPATATTAALPSRQDASQQGLPAFTIHTAFPTDDVMTPAAPTATTCAFPAGWLAYTIQAGDTVEDLAAASQISVDELVEANCLWSNGLPSGSVLYLPRPKLTATPSITLYIPSATTIIQATTAPCGAPYGWVRYVVRPGETLFQLSLRFGVSVYDLQTANCLAGSTYIQAGQVLYAPNVPAVWSTATLTPLPTRTNTPIAATLKPTMILPTTAVPTTAVPTTAVPTTAVPTTAVPTTAAPTIETPTTPAPTVLDVAPSATETAPIVGSTAEPT